MQKLRIYHLPNPPHIQPFYFPVQTIESAKVALNICAYLDLENGVASISELKATTYFKEHVQDKYKAYRRSRSINASFMIDCNIQGDEFGDDISAIMSNEND